MTASATRRAASCAGCACARASGLDPAYVRSEDGILPATKFAVDAYVRFVRERHPARGGRLVADRAVRAQDPRGAHPGPAAALQLRQRGDGGLLPPPARPGAARCRLRAGLCPRACRHRREAAGGGRGPDLQVQRALGAARRAAPRLRAGRRHPDSAPSRRRAAESGGRRHEPRRRRRDRPRGPARLGAAALRPGARPLGAAGARAGPVSRAPPR